MRKIFKIGVIAIGAAMLAGAAAAATDCTPSKWGKDDTLGSANLVSAQNTLKAAALIK